MMKTFNHSFYFTIILFTLLFYGINYSQENSHPLKFTIFAGTAIPEGNFSATSDGGAGYAKTGFSVMAQCDRNFDDYFYWTNSVNMAINSFDTRSLESNLYDEYTISAGSYYSYWLMTGVGYERQITDAVKIYGSVQVGFLVSKIPDITYSYLEITNIDVEKSIKQRTDVSTTLAYSFGAGVCINNINLGVRYFPGELNQNLTTYYSAYDSIQNLPISVLELIIGVQL